MIYILCMYAFLAITFIASKDLLSVINPFLMLFIRMGACSIIFGICILAKQSRDRYRLNIHYIFYLLILSFFNIYAANIFQLIGLQYIDPVNASLWYNSTPFVIALFDFLIYKTKISSLKALSLCIGWIGFFPLVWQAQQYNVLHFYLYGAILFLLSACAMALSGLLLEKNREISLYPINLTNSLSMGIGSVLALIHYIFFDQPIDYSLSLSLNNYTMLALVIGSTALCSTLYIYFVRKHNALLVTFAGFSLPLFSIFFEFVLGEKIDITFPMIISGILITLALYLFTRKVSY